MDSEEIRKSILLQMGGKDFYRAYLKFNTPQEEEDEEIDFKQALKKMRNQ